MKRGGRLRRGKPLRRRKPLPPGRPISLKQIGWKPSLFDVEQRRRLIERDGGCRARALLPDVSCWGGLQRHHKRLRSQGGADDDANLVMLCAGHHRWAHDHPARAVELGLITQARSTEHATDEGAERGG